MPSYRQSRLLARCLMVPREPHGEIMRLLVSLLKEMSFLAQYGANRTALDKMNIRPPKVPRVVEKISVLGGWLNLPRNTLPEENHDFWRHPVICIQSRRKELFIDVFIWLLFYAPHKYIFTYTATVMTAAKPMTLKTAGRPSHEWPETNLAWAGRTYSDGFDEGIIRRSTGSCEKSSLYFYAVSRFSCFLWVPWLKWCDMIIFLEERTVWFSVIQLFVRKVQITSKKFLLMYGLKCISVVHVNTT